MSKIKSLLFALLIFSSVSLQAADSTVKYFKTEQPSVHYFTVQPSEANFDILLSAGGLTAAEFRRRNRMNLVTNGGFFDVSGKSLGLIIRRGKELNPLRKNSWGVFLMGGKSGQSPMILSREEWEKKSSTLGTVQIALQAGPRLVIDGKVPSFKENTVDRRTAVGVTKEGQVMIAVSETPLWLSEWAKLLAAHCSNALNLDGGGSSQVSFRKNGMSIEMEGVTPVPNALAVSY